MCDCGTGFEKVQTAFADSGKTDIAKKQPPCDNVSRWGKDGELTGVSLSEETNSESGSDFPKVTKP